MRARTRIQASGELKVEWRSSVNVFLGPRAGGDPASTFFPSMTMVVVDDRAEEQRHWDQTHCTRQFLFLSILYAQHTIYRCNTTL